jgi:hypothetical protein
MIAAMLQPHLDILPDAQRRLWPELAATPPEFTLHGGTAIALRLGHRASVDFDFFSFTPFAPDRLFSAIPYLRGAEMQRAERNTLVCRVTRGGPVQVSFGRLRLGQVAASEPVAGPGFAVAALLDLAGLKVAVVTQRAEARDYLDIHALLEAGIRLADMLAAAVIYAGEFNPLIALKALAYFGEPGLAALPSAIRRDLAAAVAAIDLDRLPVLAPVRRRPSLP